jgi:hypothetical protein
MSSKSNSAEKPFYLRTWFFVVAGLIVLGVIGSLTGSGDEANSPSDESSPSAETFESKGCLAVSTRLVEGIGEGFEGSTLSGRAAGFRAPDFADVKFVSVEFTPNGETDPQIAIFATNDDDLNDGVVNGLIVPADGFAKNFSDWGENDKFNVSSADKGASDSKECIDLLP